MKHMQIRVNDEEFKKIKKKAIDCGQHTEDFIKETVIEKIDRENKENETNSANSK
jgi:hypothetical protein